jgi:hypothetical protein
VVIYPSGGLVALLEQWWGWVIGSKRQIMLNTWGENMSSWNGVECSEMVWNVVKRGLTMMKILMWSTNFGDKNVLEKKIVRNYKINLLGWELVNSFQQGKKKLSETIVQIHSKYGRWVWIPKGDVSIHNKKI